MGQWVYRDFTSFCGQSSKPGLWFVDAVGEMDPFVPGVWSLNPEEMEVSVRRLRNYANVVTIAPQAMNQHELMHETNYEFMWFIIRQVVAFFAI